MRNAIIFGSLYGVIAPFVLLTAWHTWPRAQETKESFVGWTLAMLCVLLPHPFFGAVLFQDLAADRRANRLQRAFTEMQEDKTRQIREWMRQAQTAEMDALRANDEARVARMQAL